ncbi:MAG: CDP-alcohol phosphatidyltransferase family protein [Thermoanaerobaculia bacterium]|nr:CDP-alcohol phosphatidyltransferase family protein [Thermoanaerobaculia bacterium]
MIPSTPLPSRWDDRAYFAVRRLRDRLVAPLVATVRGPLPAWWVSLGGVLAAASTLWTAKDRPLLALAGFSLALLADVLDGAVARRNGTASGRGKWIDHACDAATFALLVGSAVGAGYVAGGLGALAGVAATGLVAAALAAARRRDPVGFRSHPRAGFLAHLPKLPFYVAFPLALLGGPRLVAPALGLTLAAVLFSLPWVVRQSRP